LTWVIPSIGFVGTVIGISQALIIANSGDMEKITSLLGVAFDTTLVALVLSIIIMWFVHQLQEESDRFHSDLKEFVIDNLINKIEIP
jgi:chemotaxis protein MotA